MALTEHACLKVTGDLLVALIGSDVFTPSNTVAWNGPLTQEGGTWLFFHSLYTSLFLLPWLLLFDLFSHIHFFHLTLNSRHLPFVFVFFTSYAHLHYHYCSSFKSRYIPLNTKFTTSASDTKFRLPAVHLHQHDMEDARIQNVIGSSSLNPNPCSSCRIPSSGERHSHLPSYSA